MDVHETQAGLRDEVRDFLAGELAAGAFLPRCDSWLTGFDAQFSRRVGERGWIGTTFPKQYGGAGADPWPGSSSWRNCSPRVPRSRRTGSLIVSPVLRSSGSARRISGTRHADYAVILINAINGEEGRRVAVVPLAEAVLRPGSNIAGEPRDDVVLSQVAVPPAHVYAFDGAEPGAVDLLRRGAFGRSALMAGAARGVCAYAARYAGERRQFGRPLAAMQAVQQQLAELAAEASAMTVAAEAAAAAADLNPAESWALDAARIRIAGAAGTVAAIGHQILGAIGFTEEHPLHRLTTRLWAWREEYGNHTFWSESLGAELARTRDLPLWHRITR